MSSRALISATVLLVICAFAPGRSLAQENLDAGKTPSQLFAGTCSVCHKSPRGLLKSVSPSSLPSFLRQHYTTSPNMAGVLASYLVSNGATDTRLGEAPKGAKGTKEGAKEGTREGARESAREAARERQESRQRGEAEPGTQANPDHADGRNGAAKQRLSKRGRPEEPATTAIEPKPESIKPESNKPDPTKPEAKPEPGKPDSAKSETASRDEGTKPESAKPEERPSQSAKVEQPAETSTIRPDPVPPVTPAPPSAGESMKPQGPSTATPPAGAPPQAPSASAPQAGSSTQASVTPAGTEMAVPLSPSQLPPAPPQAAATAAAPLSLPPVPPAGPPAPPISQ